MSCPICKKTTLEPYRPFCSARCKDVDLGKWLIGGYVIANNQETDSSEFGTDNEESGQ